MGSTDVLFSKKLPLTIKNPDRDKRKVRIEVCVEVHTTVSPLPKKEMVIRLTDEQDLFFLYTLHLGEEDFQSLKMQQGLLVDFSAFPQNFIDLLQSVLAEEHKEMPKFILELECNGSGGLGCSSSTLNIVETNPFKHLTHLALKFLPGSDTDVKKYLADCLKKLKDQNQILYSKLQHTESDLSQQLRQTQEALVSRTTELDSLRTEWTNKVNQMTSKHAKDLNDEKERSLQTQASLQNKYEQERRESDQSHVATVKQKDAKIYDLEAANRDLLDVKYKSDATIKELKSRLSLAEEDLHRAKTELSNLRKNNANLDGNYHEQSKRTNQLETNIALLEQEVRNKDEFMKRTSDLLETEQQQKRKLEDEVEKKQKNVKKLEISLKKLSEELTKGNQIIQRLQNETKGYHEKLKLRNRVTTEQEKVLKEQSEKMDEVKRALNDTQSQLRTKEDENQKLTGDLAAVSEKWEEGKEVLKDKENVINYLQRKLTDTQLGLMGPTEMNSTSSSYQQHAFRPQTHNFSGQSYGTHFGGHPPAVGLQPHGAVPTASGLVSTAPGLYHSRPQPQVQYNPGHPKKSNIPMPIAKSSPIGSIPEESARLSDVQLRSSSPTLGNNAQTRVSPARQPGEAVLDPKYFQKSGTAEDTPHLPRGGRNSPTSIHFSTSPSNFVTTHSNRLSRDAIVPSIPAAKAVRAKVPLSSAYFPGNQGKVT